MIFADLLFYAERTIRTWCECAENENNKPACDSFKKDLEIVRKLIEKYKNTNHPICPIDGYVAAEYLTDLYNSAKGSARQAYSIAIDLIRNMPDITKVDDECGTVCDYCKDENQDGESDD